MGDAAHIFDETVLGVLATVDQNGQPWATPLHVATDGEAVYWLSSPSADHSRYLEDGKWVSLAVFSPDESQGPKGVFINGSVERLDDTARPAAYTLLEQRFGKVPGLLQDFPVYRMLIGTLDEAKSYAKCWYFYGENR